MWIATNFGWFSTVEDRDNSDMVYVRSRNLKQIEELISYMDFECEIVKNNNADYRYRIHISKKQFKSLLNELVDGIDYDNFKNSIMNNKLKNVLMEVWSIMYHAYDR